LKNIHPGLSVHLRLGMKGTIFYEANFPLLEDAETQAEKKGKNQRKGKSNDPTELEPVGSHLLLNISCFLIGSSGALMFVLIFC